MDKLSLGKFVNLAINEMFKGILMGELENEKLLAELKASIYLSNESYIQKYFKENQIRLEILNIFPTQELNKSSVDYGEIYLEPTIDTMETPAIKALIDYDMKKGIDYALNNNTNLITEEGYKNIYKHIANTMVLLEKSYINALIKKGIPKLSVSSGKLNAKVILDMDNIDKTKVNGLYYSLYKHECNCNNTPNPLLISNGITNNLQIKDPLLEKSDMAIFQGYIIICTSDNYMFTFNSCKNIDFQLNHTPCTTNELIFFKKGTYPIKITLYNLNTLELNLILYIKTYNCNWFPITDKFFLRETYLEESFQFENNTFNKFNENIKVKFINSNIRTTYDLCSNIGDIEITYKINNDE